MTAREKAHGIILKWIQGCEDRNEDEIHLSALDIEVLRDAIIEAIETAERERDKVVVDHLRVCLQREFGGFVSTKGD